MSRRIARPYAAALYAVVEKHGLDALRESEAQLATVAETFRSQPELLRAFEVPAVPPAAKKKLLQALAEVLHLRPETRRLLTALEQHYRLRFLAEVVATFRSLVDRKEGIVRGSVETAVEPTPAQMSALAAALGRSLGSRVELVSKVREELLAGFVVRVGSQVYDGSLRTQLANFARAGRER